jgi:microcystin-dependent protein
MPGLPITITDAGRAALINAQNTGTNALTITEIVLTSSNMEGADFAAMAALPSEIKRLNTFSGDVVADDTLHLTIRDESIQVYNLRGFGLILSNGTLFAVYGQAAPIVQKSAASTMLLAVDVVLASLTTAMIEFGDTDFINPPATVDRPGVIEIADQAEVDAGVRSDVAVPPSRLKVLLTALLGGKADTAHSHDAGHVTTGVFNDLRIPDLAMAKITGLVEALGGKADTAHNHDAGNVTTGVLNVLRIPDLAMTKITGLATALAGYLPKVSGTSSFLELVAGGLTLSAASGAAGGGGWARALTIGAGTTENQRFHVGAFGGVAGPAYGYLSIGTSYNTESQLRIYPSYASWGAFPIWHSGNFDPATKAAALHSHDWAQVTGKPVLLQFVSSLAAAGTDLNLCTTPGFYRQPIDAGATDGTNYPAPFSGIVEVLAQGDQIEQRYTRTASGDVFHRGSIGGAWSAWRKFWDSGNFDPTSKADAGHTHAWGEITGKPLTFTPSAHTHAIGDVTGLQASLDAKLDATAYSLISQAEAEAGTATTIRYVSALRIRQAIAGYASPLGHAHAWGEISGKPDFFAPAPHTHAIGDVTGLQVTLDAKLAANAYSLISQAEAEAGTATTVRYFTAQRVRQAVAAFASPLGHAHAWGEITGKPSTFTPSAHTHAAADVTSGVFDVARIPNLTSAKITDLLDLVWPAGELHLFDQATVPAGTRCLVANGAVVSRTTYARLFAAIGTRYGAGDGATTFQIPDWRGLFFRGLDNGRGLDPGRALGTGGYQASQNLQHRHSIAARSSTGSNDNYVEDGDSDGTARSMFTGYEGGSEARPVNEALLACISY